MPIDVLTGVRIPCGPWNARTCCGGEGAGAGHGTGTLPNSPVPGDDGTGGPPIPGQPGQPSNPGQPGQPGSPQPGGGGGIPGGGGSGSRLFGTQGDLGTMIACPSGDLNNNLEGYLGLTEVVSDRSLWSGVVQPISGAPPWDTDDGSAAWDGSDSTAWEPALWGGPALDPPADLNYPSATVKVDFGRYLEVGAVRVRVGSGNLPVLFEDQDPETAAGIRADGNGYVTPRRYASCGMAAHLTTASCENGVAGVARVSGDDVWFYFQTNMIEREMILWLTSYGSAVVIKDIKLYKYNTGSPLAAPPIGTAWAWTLLFPGVPRSTSESLLYTLEELEAMEFWNRDGIDYSILHPVFGPPNADSSMDANTDQIREATATETSGKVLPSGAEGWLVQWLTSRTVTTTIEPAVKRLVAHYGQLQTGLAPVAILRALLVDGSEVPGGSLPSGAVGWYAAHCSNGKSFALPGWRTALNRYHHGGL